MDMWRTLLDGDSVGCVIVFLWGGVQSNLGMYTEIYFDMRNRINEMFAVDIYDIQLRLFLDD